MKHEEFLELQSFKQKTLGLINQNERVSVKMESLALLPFVLSCFDFKKIILTKKNSFDDAFSSFGIFPKDVVGFPYLDEFKKQDYVVKSHHQEMFENASIMFSSDMDKINTCVVDERALNIPSIYTKKTENLLVGGRGVGQEDLLFFLKNNDYERVDVVSSAGEYVVRGGIIDIFSYGVAFPFRLGFLSETAQVMFFDPSSGDILRKEPSASIYPKPESKKHTLNKYVEKFIIITYHNKTLIFKNPKCKNDKSVVSSGIFESLGYQKYTTKSSKSFSIKLSPLLLSEGCCYNNVFFLPPWFLNKKQNSLPESVPLSGSLYVGDYYVHESFGVCKYLGFSPGDEGSEKVVLKFVDGKVLLDVKYLDKISFFSPASSEEGAELDSMNKTGAWKRKKKKSYDKAQEFVESMVD